MEAHKFHPYKIHVVQVLNEDDFDRRWEFYEGLSEWMDLATIEIIEHNYNYN